MTMDWTIAGEEKSLCNEQNLGACTDVNIFFDKYARLPFSSAVGDIVANTPTFRGLLALFSPVHGHSNLLYYPFDV